MKTTAFNFNDFKNGKTAINGLGQKVSFICETRGKMMVRTYTRFGKFTDDKYTIDGKKYEGSTSVYDIVGLVA